jgi:hypothetical protein
MMREAPSRLPHPDSTDRVRWAYRRYQHALEDVWQTMAKLNDYILHGTAEPHIERKPGAEETLDRPEKNTGENSN